ncbi:hypothetical protein D047_3021A, partial [Vibrio parahaemolyticus VPTS-2010_2]|jgi:hypothetical protein
MACQ